MIQAAHRRGRKTLSKGIKPELAGLLIYALAACVMTGPAQQSETETRVQNALVEHDGPLEFWTTSSWLPDQRWHVGKGAMLGGGARPGVVAITPQAITFMRWSELATAYHVDYRVRYADIAKIEDASQGGGGIIVLIAKNYRPQTFLLFKARDGTGPLRAKRIQDLVTPRLSAPSVQAD